MQSVYHVPTKSLLIQKLSLADNFFSRFKGLMFTQRLALNEGLLIKPCQQIHTHFMRFDLDVIFMTKEHRVVHVERNIRPWRITKYFKHANYVIEVNAGVAGIVNVDDQLQLIDCP